MLQNSCRMYQQRFPKVGDFVVVKITSYLKLGVGVSLLEYNNINGLLLLSELSTRRIRDVRELIRLGSQEIALVLRVNEETGHIDLSKRRVYPDDIIKCNENFNQLKKTDSIMRHVAETMNYQLDYLYLKVAWPLAAKYSNAFTAFEIYIHDNQDVFRDLDLTPVMRDLIDQQIRFYIAPRSSTE